MKVQSTRFGGELVSDKSREPTGFIILLGGVLNDTPCPADHIRCLETFRHVVRSIASQNPKECGIGLRRVLTEQPGSERVFRQPTSRIVRFPHRAKVLRMIRHRHEIERGPQEANRHAIGVRDRLSTREPVSIFRQGAYIPEISIEGEARMDVEVSEICIALRIECYARSC